jgi:hypothetical protein
VTFEKITVPGLRDDEDRTLNLLAEQLDAKKRRNELRSAYYDGKRAIESIGGVIPPQYGQIGIALGWAAKGVDGLARRCNLDKFVWTDGDLDALGMPLLEDSNFLLSEIAQARTDSLIHGVSYLVTTRGADNEPAALVHARDALSATGEWSVRRRRLDNLLSVTSRKDNKITGFVLYLDGLTITADHTDGKWEVERSTHSFGVPAEPLVYRPRSSRRMGKSRITRPLMSHQDSALRALVRLEAHMDIYTIPKTSWQIALARAFGIPDSLDQQQDNQRADVKQFSAESPEPHLADLNALAKLAARETDLPDADFALSDMANPTSEGSYIAGRDNLIAEAEGAMDDWSISIRRSVTTALAIQNGESSIPESWAAIDTKWRSPLYLSRSAAADAGSKQIGAAPWLADTEVGLELLGLDEQQIRRALAEKQRVTGRDVVAALANRTTSQGAADAVSTGVAGGTATTDL